VSAKKSLRELLDAGPFRPDRHLKLMLTDTSLLRFLADEIEAGRGLRTPLAELVQHQCAAIASGRLPADQFEYEHSYHFARFSELMHL
jgi:hypothetical protein